MKPRSLVPRRPQTYAAATYDSPYWIVRFPHRKRFETTLDLALEHSPAQLLDYGAGDGHFLVKLLGDPRTPRNLEVTAFEPLGSMRDLLEALVREHGFADRVTVCASADELPEERFDVITCLGVLEHLPLAPRHHALAQMRAALAPGGRVVIDVPVETGPALLIKNFGRRALKRRAGEYAIRETLAAASGMLVFDPQRYDPAEESAYINSHKGFDHRLLRREVERAFHVEQVVYTPFSRLPGPLGNQESIILASARQA